MVLDVCVVLGGKIIYIVEKMYGMGMVYVFDIYEKKIKLID